MNELRDTFPSALIMFGVPEMEFLQRADEWEGQSARRQETFDQVSGHKTLLSHLGSTLEYRRLLPPNRDHARLIRLGLPVCRWRSRSGQNFSRSTTRRYGMCGRNRRNRVRAPCGRGSPNGTSVLLPQPGVAVDEPLAQLSDHQAAVLAAVRGAPGCVSMTEVREQINSTGPGPALVAEQVCRALVILEQRGLVERVTVADSVKTHWHPAKLGRQLAAGQ
jgi:hypothetical protein